MIKVRPYEASDRANVRSLHLKAFPSWRNADLVDLDAMLLVDHPGFVILEAQGRLIGCGICSPDFRTKEVSLWGQAANVDDDETYALITKTLIAILPPDDAPYSVIVEGMKAREDFFKLLGLVSSGPVMTDFGVSREIDLFERDVNANEIHELRTELNARGVLIPLRLFDIVE